MVYGLATRVGGTGVARGVVYGLRIRVVAGDTVAGGLTKFCTCCSAVVLLVSLHNRVRRWQVMKS